MNGLTINEIADIANDEMTNWEGVDSAVFVGLNATVEMINAAFAKPLPFDQNDTLVWAGGKFQLRGSRALSEVSFLKQVMGNIPTTRQIRPVAGSQLPDQFVLNQNYPNPFNPTTVISFTLPEEAVVTLKIYNVLGQDVGVLIDRQLMDGGDQEAEFDARKLSSGVYFYQLIAQTAPNAEEGSVGKTYVSVKKMLLLR
ncbi:MAG: T9SS type A sorting domain-containing protein [Ignavibacteria bacterium]|nr:MAG: T9SS type A sorting domain-containing protein [Ignavibacteria bacterium]